MLFTKMQVTGLRAEGGCVADDNLEQVEFGAGIWGTSKSCCLVISWICDSKTLMSGFASRLRFENPHCIVGY